MSTTVDRVDIADLVGEYRLRWSALGGAEIEVVWEAPNGGRALVRSVAATVLALDGAAIWWLIGQDGWAPTAIAVLLGSGTPKLVRALYRGYILLHRSKP